MIAAAVTALIAGLSLWYSVGRAKAPAGNTAPFYGAVFALSAEPVVHYTGSAGGASWDIDATANGEQIGTVSAAGETINVLSVGGKLYVKPPAGLLAGLSSGSSSNPSALQDRWITGDDSLTGMLPQQRLGSPRAVADRLWSALGGKVAFPAIGAGTQRIDGVDALSVALPGETLYVTASAPYRVLRLAPSAAYGSSAEGPSSGAGTPAGGLFSDVSARVGRGMSGGSVRAVSDGLGVVGATDFQPMTQAADEQALDQLIGQTKTLGSAVDVGVQFDFNQTGNLSCSDSVCTVTEEVTSSTTSAKPASLSGSVTAVMNATVTVNGQGAGGCSQTTSLPINGGGTMTCVDGAVSGPVQAIKNQAQQEADAEAAAQPGQQVSVPYSLNFAAQVAIEAMAEVQAQVDQQVRVEQQEQKAAEQPSGTPQATSPACAEGVADAPRLSIGGAPAVYVDFATGTDPCADALDPAAVVRDLRRNGVPNGPISAADNIAAAAVKIEGRPPEMLTSVSGISRRDGTVPEVNTHGNPQRFLPFGTGKNPRNSDTEFKILNYLANQLGPSSPDPRGSVWIHSELPVCPSCGAVIREFQAMFPNVEVLTTVGNPGS